MTHRVSLKKPFFGLSGRVFLTALGILVIFLAGLAIIAVETVDNSTQNTLRARLALARVTAGRFDDFIDQTIHVTETMIQATGLNSSSASHEDQLAFVEALYNHLGKSAYYVAIVGPDFRARLVYPPQDEVIGHDFSDSNCVNHAFAQRVTQVTRSFKLGTPTPAVAMVVPVLDSAGDVLDIVLVTIDLNAPDFARLLQPQELGATGYIEVVDRTGVVLGATRPELQWQQDDHGGYFEKLILDRQTVVGTCHNCHTGDAKVERSEDLIAFAPLSIAPWGIAVRQSRSEAFVHTDTLRRRLLVLGVLTIIAAGGVTLLLTRNLVKPVRGLTTACSSIAEGNLDVPLPERGPGEVGMLGDAFDTMRLRLKSSLDEIHTWNNELEQLVDERSQELRQSREALLEANTDLQKSEATQRELLQKVITAQEEERRRIARELHDETTQALAALSVGLETALQAPAATPEDVQARLRPMKTLASHVLHELQRMIQDLRPSLLDDLGLVSALDWYVEARLNGNGTSVSWEITGPEQRLPTHVETTLFRIAQEAISNVAQHAGAEHLRVSLEYLDDKVVLEVEDDGCGFDTDEASFRPPGAGGYGLLGIRERVNLLHGRLAVESEPSGGTRIWVEIPMAGQRAGGNGHDSRTLG